MSEVLVQSVDTPDGFCVQMQVGVLREWVNIDFEAVASSDVATRSSKFLALKESAAALVARAYPEHKFVGLQNQLLLFLHQPTDANVLKLINVQTDVSEGCLIQVVLSGKVAIEDLCARQHALSIHSYKTPHFCDFCGEMLWGLVKQGLKCEACGLNFHKRCVYKIREDCMAFRPSSVKISLDDPQVRQLNGSNQLVASVRRGSTLKLQVPHSFVAHNYTLPTVCQYCHRLLPLLGQSLQCKDCKINCHKKCMELLPNNCQGEARGTIYEAIESEPFGLDSSFGDDTESDSSETASTTKLISSESTPPTTAAIAAVAAVINAAATTGGGAGSGSTTPSGSNSDLNLKTVPSNNIPLQRVVQSFRNVKQSASQTIRSDWMVWWTNHNPAKRHHYWTLDSKSITFYSEEVKKRYFKVIQLKDITRLELVPIRGPNNDVSQNKKKSACGPSEPSHVFEMVVGETTYCVGEDWGDERSEVNRERAVCFENAIRQASLPLTPQNSNLSTKEPGKVSSTAKEGKITDINQRYEINPEEVLGSGQFGIVYGAIHILKKHEVAIKVIDKAKFKDKQEAQLKNEVSILQNINHPGVVNLEFVHESKDKIYVVMEKLKGDMLEMILNSQQSRLNERITKYLVFQILIALKYLHDNNIVHCDLKPENVLLSSNSRFPQVKLCDFGFAKIIGEKSFRRSIVGTPAYLAPEVLKNKRYNRSLDMWSVGVILYVSLSGTFPFNEDEDISDQIHNAAFMFPKDPWSGISKQAVDLITRILQVQLRTRFKVTDALNHFWMQDYQCWCDLKALEEQVGLSYLTSKEEDNKWTEHAKSKKLAHWKDIGLLEQPLTTPCSTGVAGVQPCSPLHQHHHHPHTATL